MQCKTFMTPLLGFGVEFVATTPALYTPACSFVSRGDVYGCTQSTRVHVYTSGDKICILTGNTFEHDDGIIFDYDNADRNNKEYPDGYSTQEELAQLEQ